jgi:hypothetical protein
MTKPSTPSRQGFPEAIERFLRYLAAERGGSTPTITPASSTAIATSASTSSASGVGVW